MANAKLHLICGNCGCNNMWTYCINQSGHDIEGPIATGCISLVWKLCHAT